MIDRIVHHADVIVLKGSVGVKASWQRCR